jgi:hypothetical protein
MNKVKKILTTLMAATLTVSTGLTSMPMFAHNVKAESKAETISSDTNDMSQYKKINGISSQTVLGADFSHYQLQKNAWKKVWKNYKGIEVSNVFEYVRSQGINTISVKVAVNPTKDKEGNESYLPKIKRLFYELAVEGAKAPNVSQLAESINTSRATVMNYIKYLADSSTDTHTVDVHIARLRERFRDNPDFKIVTMRGVGYKVVRT